VRCTQLSAFARNIPCDCGNFSGAVPAGWDDWALKPGMRSRWSAGIRAGAEYVMPTM
jgi:hypothetical protein